MTTSTDTIPGENRLAQEKSPYLQQHRHNPVDWYPWGEEAFQRSRTEDKPIFLSIGYSTCHWCHVMERESFENQKVADFLNEHFISIKVDREERPDVDRIYMMAVQAMVGHGGWPLSVFLTGDLKPFYGGTYYPPEDRPGIPGFLRLLNQIHRVWRNRREDLTRSADELHRRLCEFNIPKDASGLSLSPSILHNAASLFKKDYDPEHGGFGPAPKFPRPSEPLFLLRYGARFGDQEAIRMVLHTCERMAAGGIHDHIGGGFSRYSVDAQWLVPHFEKMLYDNAQLSNLYLDAYLISGYSHFSDVVWDILNYVLRDMTHREGGFFSAEDADSEGKEGKFYCWTKAELQSLLNPEESKVAIRYFGITEEGNFVDHSDPNPLPNQNVLSIVNPSLNEEEKSLLASAFIKLSRARSQRIRPQRDEKILASWNGLMLGALARAYGVLGNEEWRQAAQKNCSFIKRCLWDASSRTLYYRWCDGERNDVQLLDGYAAYMLGVIDLYEVTLDWSYLEFALELAESMVERFYDTVEGGFWQSPPGTQNLIIPIKEDYDGAEPSGNSLAIQGLLRLAALTGRSSFRHVVEKTLQLFAYRFHHLPEALPCMLLGLEFYLHEPHRVVIAGDPASIRTRDLLRAAHAVYKPDTIVLGTQGPVEDFARTLPSHQGEPVAYFCTGTSCQEPTSDPKRLRELMESHSGSEP